MRVPLKPRPKTIADRVEGAAGDVAEFVRSIPEHLDTSRRRALAVAGAATGAAAGFAFWRAKHDDGPSVHSDPAKPAPWRMTQPTQAGNGESAQVPADQAVGPAPARSK